MVINVQMSVHGTAIGSWSMHACIYAACWNAAASIIDHLQYYKSFMRSVVFWIHRAG